METLNLALGLGGGEVSLSWVTGVCSMVLRARAEDGGVATSEQGGNEMNVPCYVLVCA